MALELLNSRNFFRDLEQLMFGKHRQLTIVNFEIAAYL